MLTDIVFKLFSLLFVASLCLAALVTQNSDDQGAVWWEGTYSGGSDLASMKAAVEQAYKEMAADAAAKNVERVPGTMGLLWTQSGGMFQSSVKGVQASGFQIVDECTDKMHRYQGNCAEVWALSTAEQKDWNLANSFLAVYGIMNAQGKTGFMSPCSDKDGKSGCSSILKSKKYSDLDVKCVTRNGMTKREEQLDSEWEDIVSEPEHEHYLSKRVVKKTGTKKTSPDSNKKTRTTKKASTATATKKASTATKTKSAGPAKTTAPAAGSKSCSVQGRGVIQLVAGKKATPKDTKPKGTKKTGTTA